MSKLISITRLVQLHSAQGEAELALCHREGEWAGHYRQDYEAYGWLLQRVGESRHQSCLMLASRENICHNCALSKLFLTPVR